MEGKILRRLSLLLLFAFISSSWGMTWGAEFPTKTIELIVQFAPGGPSDTTSRSIAPKLGELLGQSVICVNKPGAAGALAVSLLAKAKPDGYNIILVGNSSLTVVPNFEKVSYNPLTDFTYLCKLFNQSPMLVVGAGAPWKTMEEFLDYARKNPKKIKYGSWGQYSSGHIAMEAIGKEKAVEWGHVPFKGDAPCVTALLGGHLDAAALAAGYVPHVRAGKLRGLVMLQSYRSKNFSGVPSLRDVGIKFEAKGTTETINGMIAPKGLAREVIQKYEGALEQAGKSPEFLRTLNNLGCDSDYLPGDDFHKEVEDGYKHVAELIDKLGLKQ
jgi:tripartite-type tricarboxylate transporter receptor subunit TctC